MLVSSLLRRIARQGSLVGVAVATVLGVVALPATPALAADSLTVVSPANGAVVNNGSSTFVFHTNDVFVSPTVTLVRVGAASDTLSGSNVSSNAISKTVTATFNFALANPGDYGVTITQAAPTATTDTCASCVTVNALAPTATATSNSPTAAGSSNEAWTLTGTNFTKGPYTGCTAEPCPALSVEFLNGAAIDPKITLSPAKDSNGNVIAPTATTITKSIAVAASDTPGARSIEVFSSDGQSATCSCTFTVDPVISATTVAPSKLGVGSSGQTLALTGTNFPSDLGVAIVRDAGPLNPDGSHMKDVTVGSVTVNSPTSATLNNVSVPSTAPTGAQDVVLFSTSEHFTATFTGLFSLVTPPAPTGASYPTNGSSGATDYGQGATAVHLVVSGSNFVAGDNGAGSTVSFAPADGITITGTSATSTSVDVSLNIAGSAAATSRSVTVTNPDGSSTVCNNATATQSNTCLLKIGAGPSVSSISPPSLSEGVTGTVTVTGKSFSSPVLSFTGGTTAGPTSGSATSFTASVTASSTTPGPADVTVLNPGDRGQTVVPQGFNVDAAGVSSVSPTSGLNNAAKSVTVTGSNFDSDATLTFRLPATSGRPAPVDIVSTSSSVTGGTQLLASMPLTNADPGTYQVIVTNPDANSPNHGTGTCTCTFTVLAPAGPTISSVTPSALGSGAQHQTVTVTGTNIYAHTVATFSNSPAGVTVTGSSYQAPSGATPATLTLTVNVASGAMTSEAGNLTLTNTDGKTASHAFTVNPAPSMSAVSPSSRAASAPQFTMTFGANNAVSGATVSFSGSGITAGTATIGSPTPSTPAGFTQSVSVPVTVGNGATANQPYDVTLTNPDNGSATCKACFTVTNAPAVSSVQPNTGAVGSKPSITLGGTGFESGATVTVTHGASSIPATVNNVTASTITATFDLTNAVKETAYDVTVHNPDGGTSTLAGAFTPFGVPGAPTGLQATPGDGAVGLSWTAPADDGGSPITSYTVTYSAPTGPAGTTQTSTATVAPQHAGDPVPTSTTISNLTNGVTYTFSVAANNAAGVSPSSASTTATPAGAPAAPTGVTAKPGDQQALVSWTAPSNTNGAPITGYTVTASPGGQTASAGGSATSATVTGLTNGTAYTFTVTATSKAGTSDPSQPSAPVTPFGKPFPPSGANATAGNQQADVTWTAPADNGAAIDSYTVTASPGGATAKVDGSGTEATVTGLTNGTSYTFTVTAHNAAGDSAPSAPSNSVTPEPPVAPPPTNVVATAGDQQASLSWTAPTPNAGDSIQDYVVKTNPSGPTKTVTTTNATITGLTNGTAYTFTVTAEYTPSGQKAQSAPSNAVTPFGKPAAPTSVTASAGDAVATVTWTAADSNGAAVDGYTVTASPGGRTATVGGGATSATVTGLNNGTAYTFTVTAHNVAGTSAPSAASNSVTPRFVTHTSISRAQTIFGGKSATVTGVLRRSDGTGVAGASVALWVKPAGATSFTHYATTTTDSNGAWHSSHAFTVNSAVAAVFAGDVGDRAASATTSVTVRSTLTVTRPAAGAKVAHGRVTFTATAHYTRYGTKVVLQLRRSNGTWVTIATTTVKTKGAVAFSHLFSKGTFIYRMVISACSTNAGSATSARRMTAT